MPTSISTSDSAVVWAWLPDADQPVPAGALARRSDGRAWFRYGRRYLERTDAISLFTPLLPLEDRWIEPPPGWQIAPNLRDAAPDAWGRRVILDGLGAGRGRTADLDAVDELTYLMHSTSNRVGALDFQASATHYVARDATGALDELYDAAIALDQGQALTPALRAALASGTGIGGARPKADLRDGQRELIAKFATSTDPLPVVQAEAAAIHLARAVGIDVPDAEIVVSNGRHALLAERFDRPGDGRRRIVVSALTLSGLTEAGARFGSYPDLLDQLRRHGAERGVGRELFLRIAFNIAISNDDDHLRNHAVFWDGNRVSLTPAYDLSPGMRSGDTMRQAIAYDREGRRDSRLVDLVAAAAVYGLTRRDARDLVEAMVETIRGAWLEAADAGLLTEDQRQQLWGRQFLHRSVFFT